MIYTVPKLARIIHDLPPHYKGNLSLGDAAPVTVIGTDHVRLNDEDNTCWVPKTHITSAYSNEPHIHREAIIAWANGATIECSSDANFKIVSRVTCPSWSEDFFYRIVDSKVDERQAKIAELEQKAQELANELALLKSNA